MYGLGEVSPVDAIEAEIRKYIGEFLQLKSKLISLMRHASAEIRTRAQGLYNVQVKLEGELTSSLAKIEQMKAGAWTFGDIATLTDFASRLISHKKEVDKLANSAGKYAEGFVQPTPDVSMMRMATPVMIGGGLVALWFAYRIFR